jgi:SAM-dependent methyltransferase
VISDSPDQAASDQVAGARAISGADEARRVYGEWAETYDRDVFGVMGFTGTRRIVDLAVVHMRRNGMLPTTVGPSAATAPRVDGPVIDLGCGTGAAGQRLADLGVVGPIDGLDLSPEMIDVARAKGVYRHHFVADLTKPLELADRSYATAVSAGTFVTGHVGASAFPEILQIIKPGGLFAVVVASGFFAAGGFDAALAGPDIRVLHDTLEPVRRGGPDEGRMLVVQRG